MRPVVCYSSVHAGSWFGICMTRELNPSSRVSFDVFAILYTYMADDLKKKPWLNYSKLANPLDPCLDLTLLGAGGGGVDIESCSIISHCLPNVLSVFLFCNTLASPMTILDHECSRRMLSMRQVWWGRFQVTRTRSFCHSHKSMAKNSIARINMLSSSEFSFRSIVQG